MNKWKATLGVLGCEMKKAAETATQRISEEAARIDKLREVMLDVKNVSAVEEFEYGVHSFEFKKTAGDEGDVYSLTIRSTDDSVNHVYTFRAQQQKSLKNFEESVFSDVDTYIEAYEEGK